MAVVAPLEERSLLIERTALDASLEPAERIIELRRLRDRIDGEERPGEDRQCLLGQVETYIGALDLQREAGAMRRVIQRAMTTEDAHLRGELLAQGVSEAELDRAGLPSLEALEAAAADGTLDETFLNREGGAP
jgi:hypothetical protein